MSLSRKQNIIVLLVSLSVVISMFAGCGSKKSDIIFLDEPNPITYPEYYDLAIEVFPSNLTVDPISDYKDAAEKGQQLWQKVLGEDVSSYLDNDIEVFYVPEEDTWVVKGTLPDDYVGYLPIAIIKSDGAVLSVGWV